MTARVAKSLPAIGFLTICERPELGLVGGYLVLNTAGRPLEFHCTAPVRPSRAQEILYGPTLKPYLYGEQIGRTLVAKSTSEPLFVCTDVEPASALREHTTTPVVLLVGPQTSVAANGAEADLRVDPPHAAVPPMKRLPMSQFTLDDRQVAIAQRHATDQAAVLERWQGQARGLDLGEPFARIREAIEEAQRAPGCR